jgi:hypothetical protein
MENWIFLVPLVPALLLLFYFAWQAFKELKPTLQQVKSLRQEIQKTKVMVDTLVSEIQLTRARAEGQVEVVQGLINDSKEMYGRVKEVFDTVRSLDTLPARRAISYLKQRREDRRIPETVRYIKGKARNINTKLDESEFSQLPSLLGMILGAAALFFAFRKS